MSSHFPVATQTDQEAGISLGSFVSPAKQSFHDSACKAWCSWTIVTGTPTLRGGAGAQYNVTSLTDGGAGATAINFTTNFSSVNFTCVVSGASIPGTRPLIMSTGTYAVGSVDTATVDPDTPFAGADPTSEVGAACFGDR